MVGYTGFTVVFVLQSAMKARMEEDDDDDEDHGGLVKKIMETKKEYEQPRKTEIVSLTKLLRKFILLNDKVSLKLKYARYKTTKVI